MCSAVEHDQLHLTLFVAILIDILKNAGIAQVVATALVYFRRFYFRVDWAACDPLLAITTCLYLSAKVEETGIIPVYSIITQAQYVCNNEMDLIFQNAFNFTVNDVVESEFYILEELGCYLIIFHPYRPLTHYCHGLDDKQLLTTAWFILNDSYRTDLCLQYPPYMIALAALYLACIMKEKQLSPKMVEWFAELNVNPEELIEIATPILALYETWETFSSDKQAVRDALSRIPKPERAAAAAAAAAPSTSSPALLSNSYPQQGQK
ncbi:cyclin C [Capsaspora owczarzaki ATCC 30864]|uniref:Cyclin C n=1 Tax=Capsaspora owczarzaki (strain ATCC 30864) TaxID=595528 RepID=A0A0D2X244_CAPO3|nr:cyclin C [Capsaspora owczarzaki ATCC 30864]